MTATYEFGDDASFFGETWWLSGGYSFGRNGDGENSHMLSAKLTVEFGGFIGRTAVEADEAAGN